MKDRIRRIGRRLWFHECTCGQVELWLFDMKYDNTKHRLNKPCYTPLKGK